QFPDLDTLRLAITSGVVPPSISLAPVAAVLDDSGRLRMQSSVVVPASVLSELHRLGVEAVQENDPFLAEQVSCWPQLLPLRRARLSSGCRASGSKSGTTTRSVS